MNPTPPIAPIAELESGSLSAAASGSEFPPGFTGDMECLHKHHMAKLADARRKLEVAQNEVEKWEILEAASSKLAIVAMHHRWAKDLNTPNTQALPRGGAQETSK